MKIQKMKLPSISWAAIICIALGLSSPWLYFLFDQCTNIKIPYEHLSAAGDWIGGLSSPLISFAVFIMMYAAYSTQREELRLTREEMEASRLEAKTQNETLKMQEFENKFFHMLEIHHQIVSTTTYEKNPGAFNHRALIGRQYFQEAYLYLIEQYTDLLRSNSDANPDDKTITRIAYTRMYSEHRSYLQHYFGNIYYMFYLIDNSSLEDDAKKNFSKIIMYQLSTDEQALLFYQCIFGENVRLRDLLTTYDVFVNTNKELLSEKHAVYLYE